MTERGQITIPKRLRHKYGLRPSVELDVVERDGQLVILKAPAGESPVRRLLGIAANGETTDAYMKAIRGG